MKWLMALALGGMIMAGEVSQGAEKRDYHFDKTISRKVLENYLSRSITMMDLATGKGDVDDNIRMLKNIGAKYAGRVLYSWGSESQMASRMERAKEIAKKVRQADPDIILQGCVFEIVTTEVNGISIPAWVFEEFGMPVEKRNFRYDAMLFDEGKFHDLWGKNGSVPDITKLETRLWFYYVARSYIDCGMEAIHFGQIALIGAKDTDYANWSDALERVRKYAAKHARRHIVLCDAHTPDGGPVRDGKCLLDLNAFPLRIKAVEDSPEKGVLEVGFLDSLFKRSKGGIAPSGWKCDSLPYMVELDNYGTSDHPGKPSHDIWIWGYDEICWFAHQPESYRNEWLRYAFDWLKKSDPNGFLEMPGSRCLAAPANGLDWYFANAKSDRCSTGFNQEETIKAIWKADD